MNRYRYAYRYNINWSNILYNSCKNGKSCDGIGNSYGVGRWENNAKKRKKRSKFLIDQNTTQFPQF